MRRGRRVFFNLYESWMDTNLNTTNESIPWQPLMLLYVSCNVLIVVAHSPTIHNGAHSLFTCTVNLLNSNLELVKFWILPFTFDIIHPWINSWLHYNMYRTLFFIRAKRLKVPNHQRRWKRLKDEKSGVPPKLISDMGYLSLLAI